MENNFDVLKLAYFQEDLSNAEIKEEIEVSKSRFIVEKIHT